MGRILLLACTALLALPVLPAVAAAQDDDAIATALLAAPTRARDDAGVVSWDDGSRVVLKESAAWSAGTSRAGPASARSAFTIPPRRSTLGAMKRHAGASCSPSSAPASAWPCC